MNNNDAILADLLVQLRKEMTMLSDQIRDGKLDTAFLVAHTMAKQCELVMERLNRIKWPNKGEE
jgi:hypothetical protein